MSRVRRGVHGLRRLPAHTVMVGDQLYDDETLLGTVSHKEPDGDEWTLVAWLTPMRLVKCRRFSNGTIVDVVPR